MPKERSRSSDSRKSQSYKPYPNHGKGIGPSQSASSEVDLPTTKEWEDAICPICLDVPHNAVLLICNSHDKGCRPYMCDTSYRHSNCFDQYRKKASGNDVEEQPMGEEAEGSSTGGGRNSGGMRTLSESLGEGGSLLCPLCRGKVKGWVVAEGGRRYLNAKARSCAREACLFMGAYEELRAHARSEHPLARPAAADPARQRNWRRLERHRDAGDVISTIRSAMPGTVLLGDYALDSPNENDDLVDGFGVGDGDDDGHWWTVFLLLQVFGPAVSFARRRAVTAPTHVRSFSIGRYRTRSTRSSLHADSLPHRHTAETTNSIPIPNPNPNLNLNPNLGTSDAEEPPAIVLPRRRRSGHRQRPHEN